MRHRSKIPVEVVGKVGQLRREKAVIFVVHDGREDASGLMFGLKVYGGSELIASCASAKRLADWAWAHDVDEVQHRYDLKLSDGEL